MDEIQATLNDTTAKLQSATEQIASLRMQQQELQKTSSDLSNANAVLTYQLQSAHNDKIRCQDISKNYEVQMVEQSLEMERLQQLSDQYHDQAMMNEQLLHSSRNAEQELIRKNNQLHMQLEMQIKHVRELESRLEQSLTRWKADKDLGNRETQRCAKLSATCSSLIEKNEQLELELQRYDNRLKQYDDLPMPVSFSCCCYYSPQQYSCTLLCVSYHIASLGGNQIASNRPTSRYGTAESRSEQPTATERSRR